MMTDITRIIGMILGVIMILIGMNIGETTAMIQIERKIGRLIIIMMIVRIGIKIIHHLKILATDNNIEGVVVRKTANIIIGHQAKQLTSQMHLDNFSMMLKEKALISAKLDI